MSVDAISPIGPVHAISQGQPTAGVAPTAHDNEIQNMQLAQQEQMFSMLMQNTQSTLMSQALQAPKDDDEDEG